MAVHPIKSPRARSLASSQIFLRQKMALALDRYDLLGAKFVGLQHKSVPFVSLPVHHEKES